MTGVESASPPREDPSPGWGQSLSTGAAGIALLHLEYARAGSGGGHTAHEWVAATIRSPIIAQPNVCGLYRGAPAVAFVLAIADRPQYVMALRVLDGYITTVTQHCLNRAHQRIDRGERPALREFDLISGLTGLGAYILLRHTEHCNGDNLLRDVLTYLVRLTYPLTANGDHVPGWWCGDGPAGQPSLRWPGGHANLGMAHGIAGPLALLSIAMRRGIRVSGQTEAIERISAWLDQWHTRTGHGPAARSWWPGMVSMPELQSGTVLQTGPQRPSWCYGTPGLARAQQLAAIALGDQTRQRQVEQMLLSCVTDDDQLSQLEDPSLCHGWAGLVHTTHRAAMDAGSDSQLAAQLPRLRACMELHLRHHGLPAHTGLLEGIAGVRLVQHTTKNNSPPATRWDACLLLDS